MLIVRRFIDIATMVGVREFEDWSEAYPRCYFGFTALAMSLDAHPEIIEVIQKIPIHKVLLESDSPHLLPEAYRGEERANTPYGIEEVANFIARIRRISAKEVLTTALENAKRLYW